MCKAQEEGSKEKAKEASSSPGLTTMDKNSSTKSKPEPKPNSNVEKLEQEQEAETMETYVRRGKRVKQASLPLEQVETYTTAPTKKISKVKSSLSKKHAEDGKSGGIESLLPSIGIVVVLGFAIVAKMGWRYVSVDCPPQFIFSAFLIPKLQSVERAELWKHSSLRRVVSYFLARFIHGPAEHHIIHLVFLYRHASILLVFI